MIARAVGHGEVERADDVAHVAAALGVEHAQHQQIGAGRDARVAAIGVPAIACDDAGDVRAVAVPVVRARGAVHEVDEVHHALAHRPAAVVDLLREVVVPRRDTRIDDCDADAAAVELSLRRRAVAVAIPAAARGEQRRDRAIEVHAGDARIERERFELIVGDVGDVGVDNLQLHAEARASGAKAAGQIGTALTADDDARRAGRAHARGDAAIHLRAPALGKCRKREQREQAQRGADGHHAPGGQCTHECPSAAVSRARRHSSPSHDQSTWS